jgi:hypothetical protein
MSEFFGHVADAALLVAVALLVLTAVARGVLWSGIEGDERRIARQHLEPLATWCLIATGAYALATVLAGNAGVLPIAAAIALAVAAIALRNIEPAAVTTNEPTAAAPKAAAPMSDIRRSPAPESVPPHGRTPVPSASLWDEPNENAKRTGLWAR